MKTAMQEWFDELKANYPYMANEIYQKGFEKYLEIEKWQIINAVNNGDSTNFWVDFDSAEDYYNQTYNN